MIFALVCIWIGGIVALLAFDPPRRGDWSEWVGLFLWPLVILLYVAAWIRWMIFS